MSDNILSWYKREPVEGTIYPISREGHSLTFIENLGVLMFGGFGASLQNEFFLYDIETNKWSNFKASGRHISPHPYLFIYGGQGEKGRSLGDIYVMNINDENKRWRKVIVDPPHARHQHSFCGFRKSHPRYHEKKKYLFGGINMPENILYNDFWILDFSEMIYKEETKEKSDEKSSEKDVLDLEGCRFEQVKYTGHEGNVPEKRKGHTSLCHGNSMYVFGGQTQNIFENTTDFVYILDLSDFFWDKCDVSLSKISPRCQMSLSWLSNSVILLFGGLENTSNHGLSDLMCLDLENMHFSFPFTAGEYPEPRYGHASCNYSLDPSEPDSLMLLGGINHGFCTMDIFTLVEIKKRTGQKWVKVIEKNEYEKDVFDRASKYVYEARQHCLNVHDIIIKEKSKGIEIRKKDEVIKEKYLKVTEECMKEIEEKDEEIRKVENENLMLREQMRSIVEVYNAEEKICELFENKSLTLEEYFKGMQEYLVVSHHIFMKIKGSKKIIF